MYKEKSYYQLVDSMTGYIFAKTITEIPLCFSSLNTFTSYIISYLKRNILVSVVRNFNCHFEAQREISQVIANTKLEIPHFVSE